jgi:hypothetical protein
MELAIQLIEGSRVLQELVQALPQHGLRYDRQTRRQRHPACAFGQGLTKFVSSDVSDRRIWTLLGH